MSLTPIALPAARAARLAERLLEWYAHHRRTMPWRDHPDPYAVWVSEIMLQQTRVDTVDAYFRRFYHAFPTVDALAAASIDDVLKQWQGLGYYSRARNLQKAAKQLVADHDSQLPRAILPSNFPSAKSSAAMREPPAIMMLVMRVRSREI